MVEEDIAIGKREVERGHVRIFSRVTEQPVEESVRLARGEGHRRTPSCRSSQPRMPTSQPLGRRSLR